MSKATIGEHDRFSSAAAMERWARQRSGSALLGRAIGMAASAEAQGHACARLDAESIDLQALRSLRWVGDGSTLTPTVMTEDGEFFLWRNWRHEERIAAAIAARMAAIESVDDRHIDTDLQFLFSNEGAGSDASAEK